MAIVDFSVGDVVQLRKPHPCGGSSWTVYRVGADIGLRCQTCAHRVMLERRVAEKRLKIFVSRAATDGAGADGVSRAAADGAGDG